MLHRFSVEIGHIPMPLIFPSPFMAVPHPLCMVAAEELKAYIVTQTAWQDELQQGKMFGVMVVKDDRGEVGYLAAFSGNLEGKNYHSYFVPPVADILNPAGFFRREEQVISGLNRKIEELERSDKLAECSERLSRAIQQSGEEIAAAKQALAVSRAVRENFRQQQLSEEDKAALVRESQHEKAEFKRMERGWKRTIMELQEELDSLMQPIVDLRTRRKQLSADLQRKLFDEFRLLNSQGETKGLSEIFKSTVQRVPPAGAGECAGPKLLQYAYKNQLVPVAMAEFWWGNSPKGEVRSHGNYYPACKGKCEPILGHMLKGMPIYLPSNTEQVQSDLSLSVVFEDEWLLLINKPAGMLSAPGKTGGKSVIEHVREQHRDGESMMLVHRLDMATSGLLLIAKSKEVYKLLQAQFERRTVKKRYVALLDGVLSEDKGTINLPLSLDLLDRPRQMVSYEHGKRALTHWEVLSKDGLQTRVAFYPVTGRTHQLRVHAAHQSGLNCAIVGDELYGRPSVRLYLHAERLEFTHPIKNTVQTFEVKADF